jgi:type IV pilus assembly protein PilA
MRRLAKQAKRGFTLVELMIVVAIVGVLAALAIYGVNKYVNNAKTTEARSAVARIAKDATTAYQRPRASGTVLAAGASAAFSNEMCTSATLTPSTVPKSAKYQSTAAEWNQSGWACLRFSMTDPQQYSYNYQVSATTGDGATFTATANGDLDGDSTLSTFTMGGKIVAAQDNSLLVSPNLDEVNALE